MKRIVIKNVQPCYFIENENVKLYTTVQAGCTMPYFNLEGEEICPYYLPLWWNETPFDEGNSLLYAARGNFFCMPMGGDPTGYNTDGEPAPIHGNCANEPWLFSGIKQSDDTTTLEIQFDEKNGKGEILKRISLVNGENVVYEDNIVTGYSGKYPVAYHPMIALCDTQGASQISMSKPLIGYTTNEPFSTPAELTYTLFAPQVVSDMTKVKTLYGDYEDLTHQPIRKGYEEVVMFISDASLRFSYLTVTNPEKDYVYFQIKNPRTFQSTMLWISNGGRHMEPWNGRTFGCMGAEDMTSYFFSGSEESAKENMVNREGYKTFLEFAPDNKYSFRIITGVAKTPKGFTGVKDVTESEKGIIIEGENGEIIDVPMNLSFIDADYRIG